MKHRLSIFFCLVLLFSCKEPLPRAPITVKKSTIIRQTIQSLKIINEQEEEKIKQYILSDSLQTYKSSPNGYWYSSSKGTNKTSKSPKAGDIAILEYEISDLNDNVIYSKELLGLKRYKVDKEDFIPALQLAIKEMYVGETVKFVVPSFNAFGVTGDNEKIGINQSIIIIVTLKELINENKNDE